MRQKVTWRYVLTIFVIISILPSSWGAGGGRVGLVVQEGVARHPVSGLVFMKLSMPTKLKKKNRNQKNGVSSYPTPTEIENNDIEETDKLLRLMVLKKLMNNNNTPYYFGPKTLTRHHSAKPAIIFATQKKMMKKRTNSVQLDPLRNQTETETNGVEESSTTGRWDDNWNGEESDSITETTSTASPIIDIVVNETESQIEYFTSASLRNDSIIVKKKPEIAQVWSNKHEVMNSAAAGGLDEVGNHINGGGGRLLIAGFLKKEIWTIPLFVFALLNIVLITLFEIYVLCRTKGQQSKGHLFLGQMLLVGLFLCSTLALLIAIQPSTLICFAFRIGVGLGYAVVFSVLMVKCMFLLCLDLGLYLPTVYQGALLFFSVLVQVVLDTQCTIFYPAVFLGLSFYDSSTLVSASRSREELSVFNQCGSSFAILLYSLWYIGFLVILVGFLSAKATFRGISENYKEAVYILMSIIVTVPISISWILAGWILDGQEQDACIAFGLVAHSLAVFLIMFMPKGRQLAAMGKDPYYFEDDDQLSRYSPSFFHFKPSSKSYGNLYTTLEPTLSTINPNVFFY